PCKTSPAAGYPAAARVAATTPLCDAKPTPSRLVSDGATVLLPATVERQKAMPSALCMPSSFSLRILPQPAAEANGPSAMARACTGFGLVAKPRRMPKSTPRQTAVIKSLPDTLPDFSANANAAGITVMLDL